MAAQCQDAEIKATLEKACKMHESHYNRMLGHIASQQASMNQSPNSQNQKGEQKDEYIGQNAESGIANIKNSTNE